MPKDETPIERAAEKLATALFLGLLLNGCLTATNRTSIQESQIVDEKEIADAILGASCLQSGRDWNYGQCQEPETP